MKENKKRKREYTPAHKEASAKYQRKLERIQVFVTPEQKERYAKLQYEMGVTYKQLLVSLLDEACDKYGIAKVEKAAATISSYDDLAKFFEDKGDIEDGMLDYDGFPVAISRDNKGITVVSLVEEEGHMGCLSFDYPFNIKELVYFLDCLKEGTVRNP